MVGYTQEIWFARTTKAFSQQSAGDNDEENDAEDNDDDDGHDVREWSQRR